MAAGITANLEQVFAAIQHIGALQNAIAVMTLIAPGLDVFFVVERPQPVLVPAVRFFYGSCAAPVAAVTRRAAKPIRIVCLKQFFIRMRDKRSRFCVFGLVLASSPSHFLARQLDGFTHSKVTRFTAVDDHAAYIDLFDLKLEVLDFLLEPGDLISGQTTEMVLHVLVAFLLSGISRLSDLDAIGKKAGLFVSQAVIKTLEIDEGHRLTFFLTCVIGHFKVDFFLSFLFDCVSYAVLS